MNITRKLVISMGSGVVLACGLIVTLVLITAPLLSRFSLSVQKSIPYFIFVLSLLVIAPVIARRLNRLVEIRRIFGWTFIGLGAEFMAFPLSLMFVIKSAPSLGILLVLTAVFAYSLVFGVLAGVISIAIGILLIRKK